MLGLGQTSAVEDEPFAGLPAIVLGRGDTSDEVDTGDEWVLSNHAGLAGDREGVLVVEVRVGDLDGHALLSQEGFRLLLDPDTVLPDHNCAHGPSLRLVVVFRA